MLRKFQKRISIFLQVTESAFVLFVVVLLTDPVLLFSLNSSKGSGKIMMCTCSTCRDGPGECHCAMCHMMDKSSDNGNNVKQICDCDSRNHALMLDYYFPCYNLQKSVSIIEPESPFEFAYLSDNLSIPSDYVSGIFRPPKNFTHCQSAGV